MATSRIFLTSMTGCKSSIYLFSSLASQSFHEINHGNPGMSMLSKLG